MNDLIYKINKETKTIECTTQNCKRDFMRITDKVLSMYPEHIRYFYKFISTYHCEKTIKDEYTGRAVCSGDDKFNERYGKDIARTKAIIKREEAFMSTLEAIFDDIDTLIDVNLSIDRNNVLEKHLDNMCDLLDYEKSLAHIRGYSQDVVEENEKCNDSIDDNLEYAPHFCNLCEKSILNYTDDIEFDNIEASWSLLNVTGGTPIEICPECKETLNKLSNK